MPISIESIEILPSIDGIDLTSSFKIQRTAANDIWVATVGNGVIRLSAPPLHLLTSNSALPNDQVWEIDGDLTGQIWGASADGLFKIGLNDEIEVFDTTNAPLLFNAVQTVAVDHNDYVWFANGNVEEGGLMFYDQIDHWGHYDPDNSLMPTRLVNTITFDADQNVWIGHGMFQGKGGIWSLSSSGKQELISVENSDLKYNWISQLLPDQNHDIWIASDAPIYLDPLVLHGTLQRWRDQTLTLHDPAASITSSNRVRRMAFDHHQNLWVATDADQEQLPQILIYTPAQDRWWNLSMETKELPTVTVTDICIEGNDVWMASAAGIIHLEVKYVQP